MSRRSSTPVVYVALLRGVNVGAGRKVSMEDLRGLVREAGGADVSTYIQSGNVVFTHPSPEEELVNELEARIENMAGFQVAVILRSREELTSLIASAPFAGAAEDPTKFHVLFLKQVPPKGAVDRLEPAEYEPESFALRGRDLYLHLPIGLGRAKLNPALFERVLKTAGTARNWKTVTRLVELAEQTEKQRETDSG